jgi:hypothetical protein
MIDRLLTLDKRLPLVWQDPNTLQIGFDPPVVVLWDIDDRLLPVLHEIHKGISDTGALMLAKLAGVPDSEVQSFLIALEPALEAPDQIPFDSFILQGSPDLVTPARGVLESLGHTVFDDDQDQTPGAEVLLLAHYVPEPRHFHFWLRQDRPHTPIVFTDQSIWIGPRVVPGVTRCLRCYFLGDPVSHPTRLAVASQLWGKAAPAAKPPLIRLATWHARWLMMSGDLNTQLRLDALTRETNANPVTGLGECSCLGFD